MTFSRSLLFILAAAASVYVVDLGGSSIWDANEAFYVETPREMIERGDYVFPTFNYEPRLNKPVLSYWMVAGLYKAFGISVGVQRLGTAVGALILIAVALCLGWLACAGPDAAARRATALLAACGLAVDPRLVMFSRRIFIDIWISAFMALTLLFFALSERFPERRRLFLVLMYVSVGLGVLTKGPVAAALPGLVFALYLASHGELRRVREMMVPLGVLIVLAIVAPWYFALYQRDGWTYIAAFFIGENLGRYTSGVGVQSPRGFGFYPPVVFGDAFPLSLFLIPAAVLWWKGWRHAAGAHPARRTSSLLWLWILVIVGFFSFSHDKQDLYIFPIVPVVAALGAAAFIGRGQVPKTAWTTSAVLALLLAAAGASVLYIFTSAGRVYALDGARLFGAVASAGGLAAALLVLLRRQVPAMVTVLITLAIMNWLFVLKILPDFERYKPVTPLSDFVRPLAAPDDVIATYNVNAPSMVYYLRRHVDIYYAAQPFVDAVRGERRMFGVLSEGDYRALEAQLGRASCVLHRVPTFEVKLRDILARDPPPQLLLITNRCSP
ncbi:MAG TPA: phospholipid carrier-dependent glycosyltransferase [Vicinamibacterales bacterium]|nr:phospholipid carrier-dependent glycosyltransferase [Vicinamibacterales bacterium]